MMTKNKSKIMNNMDAQKMNAKEKNTVEVANKIDKSTFIKTSDLGLDDFESVTRTSIIGDSSIEFVKDKVINHIPNGCSHNCSYCFAAKFKTRYRQLNDKAEWATPKYVEGVLELLDIELEQKRRKKIESFFLCSSGDPFLYGDQYKPLHDLTIEVIKRICAYGAKSILLTKGLLPVEELSSLASNGSDIWCGISLVSLDEKYREVYEPGTAPMAERLERLKQLHDKGIKTFISMEPIPVPSMLEGMDEAGMTDALKQLLQACNFCDLIIFGRGNDDPMFDGYEDNVEYYKRLAAVATEWAKTSGVRLYVKRKVFEPRKSNKYIVDENTKEKINLPKVDLFC